MSPGNDSLAEALQKYGALKPPRLPAEGRSTDPQPSRVREFAQLALPTAALALLYLLTLSENLSASHDSVQYINVIESGRELFHPHHLLYFVASAAWLRALGALGLHQDGALLVASLNAVCGALSMAVFYRLVRRNLGASPGMAWLATALPALSFGVWFYSACVEVYVVPLLFLLLAAYRLTAPALRPRDLAWVGLMHAAAVLFHQAHVLFGVVVLVALWRRREQEGLSLPRAFGAYLAAAVPTVALTYLAVMFGALRLGSVPAAWQWFTEYAHNEAYWRSLSLGTVVKAAVGFGRAIVGGHFVFAIPSLRHTVEGALGGHSLEDEAFLVRHLHPGAAAALLVAAGAFGALVLTGLVRGRRAVQPRTPAQRELTAITLAWLATFSAFFLFWEPENLEFWIPQSVCFWLLFVARVMSRTERPPVRLLGAIAALLLLMNGLGDIAFATRRGNDLHYARVEALAKVARAGDLVVLGDWWIQQEYVTRFTGAHVTSLERGTARVGAEAAVAALRTQIGETLARGHAVYLSEAVLTPRPHWQGATPASEAALGEMLQAHSEQWGQSVGRGGGRYRVLRR